MANSEQHTCMNTRACTDDEFLCKIIACMVHICVWREKFGGNEEVETLSKSLRLTVQVDVATCKLLWTWFRWKIILFFFFFSEQHPFLFLYLFYSCCHLIIIFPFSTKVVASRDFVHIYFLDYNIRK